MGQLGKKRTPLMDSHGSSSYKIEAHQETPTQVLSLCSRLPTSKH